MFRDCLFKCQMTRGGTTNLCSRFIRVWSQDSITCPSCDSGFVEEIENAPLQPLIATNARRKKFPTAAMYMIESRSSQDQSPGPVLRQSGRNGGNLSLFNPVIMLRRLSYGSNDGGKFKRVRAGGCPEKTRKFKRVQTVQEIGYVQPKTFNDETTTPRTGETT
ncbi:hypothetical protein NL676_025693 [Syzygium grande]|nr:hypothetical protein NL676_025693 [Syzygium grande]